MLENLHRSAMKLAIMANTTVQLISIHHSFTDPLILNIYATNFGRWQRGAGCGNFLPLSNIDEVQFDSIVVLHLDGRNKERPAENLGIHFILNIIDSMKLKQVFESNRTTKTTMLGVLTAPHQLTVRSGSSECVGTIARVGPA